MLHESSMCQLILPSQFRVINNWAIPVTDDDRSAVHHRAEIVKEEAMATTTSSTPVAMSGPAGPAPPPGPGTAPSPIPQQWKQPPMQHAAGESQNLRSVTPAMNNTRGAVSSAGARYPARQASPIRQASPGRAAHNYGGAVPPGSPGPNAAAYGRSGTPQRYYSAYNGNPASANTPSGGGMAMGVPGGSPVAAQPLQQQQPSQQQQQPLTPSGPSSTGLIRLTLRKPMGIVFEPMYDPHNPSAQRGVRICDLPRTGAAALSRTLEVGDELLSINDKTMSRLTFDEIMDFIIEADPDQVNLLFRRPRKEALAARVDKQPTPSVTNTNGVKWVDDDHRQAEKEDEAPPPVAEKRKEKVEKKKSSPTKSSRKDDDDTLQSSEDERQRRRRKKNSGTRNSSRRNRGSRRDASYEQESFLDMLIDSICANTDVCRDGERRGDDEYYSDDDGTFASADDSTYVTYESDDTKEKKRSAKSKAKKGKEYYEEEETATSNDSISRLAKKKAIAEKPSKKSPPKKQHYEDDGTLETEVSADRAKQVAAISVPVPSSPLGLEPQAPIKEPPKAPSPPPEAAPGAPIAELEYDGRIDADVSVMESLGGPSLLIEKQRQANMVAANVEGITENVVSRDLVTKFGTNYPADFGYSSEQTIQRDPMRFYTYVVKMLLEEHEPEKVRLLDKLLAKYKGREEHLVRKLSVRYDKAEDQSSANPNNSAPPPVSVPEDGGNGNEEAFANDFVPMEMNQVSEDAGEAPPMTDWPITEKKEDDAGQLYADSGENMEKDEHSQGSYTGSEFSGDSIDGTSPAVIAQVSELLNYVYGKTSVPGQIDRVSTIMRAYEGREAVLLELLETKALIKANAEKEGAENLPSFLRNSSALQNSTTGEGGDVGGNSNPISPGTSQPAVGGMMQDDISSMSGVSAPANGQAVKNGVVARGAASNEVATKEDNVDMDEKSKQDIKTDSKTPDREKKKKKGMFGGLFRKNKKGKDVGKKSKAGTSSQSVDSI